MNANLLVDPCLRVQNYDGREELLTLPGVLARLEQDAVMSFPGLRAHQTHPWFAFCCQLAALALEGDTLPDIRRGDPTTFLGGGDEAAWRERFRSLTADWPGDEPWTLVVDDWSKPAFLQAPYSGTKPRSNWEEIQKLSPDDLDVLIQSKAHAVKQSGMVDAPLDAWIFALISVQTHAQYANGNYNSSRQNSKVGTRACVHLAPTHSMGLQFCRDARLMLDHQNAWYDSGIDYDTEKGLQILWLQPWDGQASLPLAALHPWYIEVARLYRLVPAHDSLKALFLPSNACRIEAKEAKGNVGDPWIPIEAKDSKAFNKRPLYNFLAPLLFRPDEYRPSLTQCYNSHIDPPTGLSLDVSILLRGKRGKSVTEGYEYRRVPLPGRVAFLQKPEEAGEASKNMINIAEKAQYEVLRTSLYRLNGRKPKDQERAWAQRFVRDLDAVVDEQFFPALWDILARRGEGNLEWNEALAPWRKVLRDAAWNQLMRAEASLPQADAQRYKRQAVAESLFDCLWKKHCEPLEESHGSAPRRRATPR